MKVCCRCEKDLDINEYPFRNKEKNIRHSACKVCWKDIRKESYNKNKDNTLKRNRRNRKKARNWYNEYKTKLKCDNCEENHPACLDFHHTNVTDKKVEVSKLINTTISIESIIREIEKCIVLCANCHRKLHYNEKNGSVL